LSRLALRRLGLDTVWWLVAPQNPLKPVEGMAPLALRLEAARARASPERRILVSALEQKLGTRFTADTLRALKRRYPRLRFVWLMGADNLPHFTRWRRWAAIYRAVPVAIFDRAPYAARVWSAVPSLRFARARRPEKAVRRLVASKPPAWSFLHSRLHPASASTLRTAGRGLERKGERRSDDRAKR
jgi:nicotinate-nucleotide adenylyltransferase